MKLSVEVENFRPLRSNILFGFATVFIPELHLRIVDCPVHEKNGTRWISLPAKLQRSPRTAACAAMTATRSFIPR